MASALNVSAVVFGCTGILGNHIAGGCAENGYTTILPFRFRSVPSGIRQFRCLGDGTNGQMFDTDFEMDKEYVVKNLLTKVDHVFNVIGAWQEPAVYEHSQSWFSMEGINVEWPRLLARWSRELGILRFVHLSMVGADLNSPSLLLRQKAMAELAVLEEFPNATIIRATDIFSGNDTYYTRYLKAQRYWKITPVPNRGLRIHQPVFAGDVAEAACRALLLDHTEGRIAELGGPVRFTTNDYLRWCSEVNGLNHKVAHIPKWMWQIGCAVNERIPWKTGGLMGAKKPLWNKDWLDRQFIDNCAMPERDPELMDWEDFGIASEDLFRLEEKYYFAMLMWSMDRHNLELSKA